jgi:choline-sulfatase
MTAARRPNIVWIMGDEFRTDALSCYGTPFPEVVTPNMDRIAAAGVRFEHCYCNSPICVPSRTSFMTATLPEENGVFGNEGSWASFPYDRDFVTIPEHLARAGYRTVNFGKTHLPVALHPWQIDEHDGADLGRFYDGTDPALRRDEVYTPTLKAAIGGTFRGPAGFPGERVTRNAVRWLREEAGGSAPFLLGVGYLQPHSPVVPPLSHAGIYDGLPWPDDIGAGEPGSDYERRFVEALRADALAPAERRRVQADYHALVRWLDDQVGAVLDAIEASGLAEDTIVVLEADHGVSLGERGRLQKHTFFPEVHRVPRLVAWPGRLPEGQVRGDLAQSLDLARTLCGLAGIAPAESFGGRDLFAPEPPPEMVFASIGFGERESYALPNQVVGNWSDGTGWPRRACVRTARFRLDMTVRRNGRPVGPDEEDPYLADLAVDPLEAVNRADDPLYAAVLESLRQALREQAATAHEPASVPVYSEVERGIN